MARDRDIAPGPVPAEVLGFWRQKGLKVGFDYRDVWNEEHNTAFSAAKILRIDVVGALRDEIDKAIAGGVPFEKWRRSIEPRLREMGWWAPHEVVDPATGKVAQVDPPSRLKRIYDTNLRASRAVGQWERIQRSKRTKPYLLYQVGPSARHREQHLAWHGLLLSVDDEFWAYAYPPNGYGCKCHVRAVSAREADRIERDGVLAPDPDPELDEEGNPTGHVKDRRVSVVRTPPRLDLVPWRNERTGNVELIPRGIQPGFNHPPGEGRQLYIDSRLGQQRPENTQT